MKEKIKAAREQRDAALQRMQEAAAAIDELPEDATEEQVAAADAALGEAEEEFERSVAQLARLERVASARAHTPILVPADAGGPSRRLSMGDDRDLVYRQDRPASFFADLWAAHKSGSMEARQRLEQHTEQARAIMAERRDVTTADPGAGGIVPPVYLADLLAETARPGRPFCNIIPRFPFPPAGTTLTVPRITTATTTAVQAAQGDAPSETDIDFTTLSVPLVTIAGQQDVSIQALERTFPGLDQVLFRDLTEDYDEQCDVQCLAGTGSSGQHLGIRAVTGLNDVDYTDGTPTAAELVPKLYDAIQRVYSNRFRAPSHVIIHPRRAGWLASNLSSTFALFQLGSLNRGVGQQDAGLITNLAGLQVVIDPNIGTTYSEGGGTNEDEIYVVRDSDLYFAEGPMRTRVLEDVLSGTLQVRLQVFAYSYLISGRFPAGISRIQGSGLAAPTF